MTPIRIHNRNRFAQLVQRLKSDGIDCYLTHGFNIALSGVRPVSFHWDRYLTYNTRNLDWHYRDASGTPRALGALSYEDLRDVMLALTYITPVNKAAITAALDRLALSPENEQRHLAHIHPLYPEIRESIRVHSALLA